MIASALPTILARIYLLTHNCINGIEGNIDRIVLATIELTKNKSDNVFENGGSFLEKTKETLVEEHNFFTFGSSKRF